MLAGETTGCVARAEQIAAAAAALEVPATEHLAAKHGATKAAAEALVHEVPNLLGRVQPDDKTIRIVMRGQGAMPGYEQSFDRFDAKRVLQHMQRLQLKARKPAQGDTPKPAEDGPPADEPAEGVAPQQPKSPAKPPPTMREPPAPK